MFLLRIALRPWRSSWGNQLLAIASLGILIFFSALLYWFGASVSPVIKRLTNEQIITAYLEPSVTEDQQVQVVDSIRVIVGSGANRDSGASIDLIEPEDFLAKLDQPYPELAQQLRDLGPEFKTVVPKYINISGDLTGDTLGKIKALPFVAETESSADRYESVSGAFRAFKIISLSLLGGALVALITAMVLLSRLNQQIFSDSLSVFRLLGADETLLRMPNTIAGLITGLSGGVVAALIWLSISGQLGDWLRLLSPFFSEIPEPGYAIIFYQVILGVLIGVSIGFLLGKTSTRGSKQT